MTTRTTDTIANWTRPDVPDEDRPEYDHLIAALEADFQPVPGFEVILASEIVRDTWRLRCYADATTQHAGNEELLEALQRRRNSALSGIRRNIAELRRFQTERQLRTELGDHMKGLGSTRELVEVSKAIRTYVPKRTDEPNPAAVAAMESAIHLKLVRQEQEMDKRTQAATSDWTGAQRNWPCHCGSGLKFKRCCHQTTAAAA